MVAYADLDDYNAIVETTLTPDSRKANRIIDLLDVATEEVVGECGRDFFRHPTTGVETFTVDAAGGNVLHFHEGLISLDLIEYTLDYGASFTEFGATDWSLRGVDYSSTAPSAEGEPYFHVVLGPGSTTLRSFPRGQGALRLTGARGWTTPPRRVVEMTAQRARQMSFGDPTYSGSVPGPEDANPYDYAQRLVSFRWPNVAWTFIRAHNRRFIPCSL